MAGTTEEPSNDRFRKLEKRMDKLERERGKLVERGKWTNRLLIGILLVLLAMFIKSL